MNWNTFVARQGGHHQKETIEFGALWFSVHLICLIRALDWKLQRQNQITCRLNITAFGRIQWLLAFRAANTFNTQTFLRTQNHPKYGKFQSFGKVWWQWTISVFMWSEIANSASDTNSTFTAVRKQCNTLVMMLFSLDWSKGWFIQNLETKSDLGTKLPTCAAVGRSFQTVSRGAK